MGGSGYASGGNAMMANVPMEQTLEEKLGRDYYKVLAGMELGRVFPVQVYSYTLPNSFVFPTPAITPAQLHSFSVRL